MFPLKQENEYEMINIIFEWKAFPLLKCIYVHICVLFMTPTIVITYLLSKGR